MSILRITLDSWRDIASVGPSVDGEAGDLLSGTIEIQPSLTAGAVLAPGLHLPDDDRMAITALPWSAVLVDPTSATPSGWGYRIWLKPTAGRAVPATLTADQIAAVAPDADGVRVIRLEEHVGLASGVRGVPLVTPIPGPTGPPGPQGAIGPAGPTGPQGDIGPAGPTGPQGPQGMPGPAGPTGPAGPQGTQGAAGPQGDVGPRGLDGPAGPQGQTGPKGDTGQAGATGPKGDQGLQGLPGPVGPDVTEVTGTLTRGPATTGGTLGPPVAMGRLRILTVASVVAVGVSQVLATLQAGDAPVGAAGIVVDDDGTDWWTVTIIGTAVRLDGPPPAGTVLSGTIIWRLP